MQPKSRYDVLLKLIAAHKPKTIVEVGTWNGLRAVEMLREARKHQNKVRYIGYDLFEDATPETDSRELNVKAHASIDGVSKTIGSFAKSIKRVDWSLFRGDTRDTLHGKDPLAGMKKPILAFIDGGHSVETIRGDYQALKKADIIVMDDFYNPDEKGQKPDTEKFGCNMVIKEEGLDGIMAGADPVKGGGKVALFIYPADKFPGQVQLRVQTKNCVPDSHILANVAYNTKLITSYIQPCDRHDLTKLPMVTDYRFQGVRFAHKVFAMTADCLPKEGIRVWLDADTETTRPIDRDYLARCFPGEDEICAYLGRTQWHHSETGWLAFNMNDGGLRFLRGLRSIYENGHVVAMKETHDAWVFDVMRFETRQTFPAKFKNLSPNSVGLDAWPHSPLGERMIHRKGNLKLA